MTCPGPANGHSILLARLEPWISSDNLTAMSTRLHIYSLESTCATISLCSRTLAYASLHYYHFFSKWICFAHGICEFTPISTSKNTKSTMRNALQHESRYLLIIRQLTLKKFILQSGTTSEMHWAARGVIGQQC